ncbi:hypothetical protein [Frankia sp. R82]|uniref:hypothetical protein n=1 Tax=Frankia sp. R82 TaxID=2950553 RepID=UPI0020433AC4|nr:hypothetical protein [Frankia sp. R82]MCM3886746.1 hypothetical protein [Frankia sp. R82]
MILAYGPSGANRERPVTRNDGDLATMTPAPLIPAGIAFQTVVAESAGAAVVLGGLRVWPHMFDFRLLVLGIGAIFPSTREEVAALRATGTLEQMLEMYRPEPEAAIEIVECSVTLPALPPMPGRARRMGARGTFGRSHVDYRVTALPVVGDVVVEVSMPGLTGAVVVPGDDLRAAAMRARPPGTPVQG